MGNDTATSTVRARAWCTHSMLVGVAMGGVLAAADQLSLTWIACSAGPQPAAPTAAERLAAVLVLASGYGLLALVAGVPVALPLRRTASKIMASITVAVALTALAALHLLGLVVRVLSGSFVTVGAVEFALCCREHLWHVVNEGYLGLFLLLLAAAVGLGFVAGLYLLRRMPTRLDRSGWERVLYLPVAAPSLLYAGATWAAPAAPFVSGVSRAAPELALLASLDPAVGVPALLAERAAEAPGRGGRMAGPALTAAEHWEAALPTGGTGRPNVLLVVVESLSTRHVGYLGYSRQVTPNLDRLAERSVRFLRAWATATHSNYSQMAILSSLFPRRGHGLDLYERLDYPRVLQHDLFGRMGYATATVSSQDEDWQGMRRYQTTSTPTYFWHADDHPGPHIHTSSEKAAPDRVTVGVLLDWLRRHRGQPWAAYLNLQSTHFPYRIPKSARRPYQPTGPTVGPVNYFGYADHNRRLMLNRYDNALYHVDQQLGRIYRYLKKTEQLDRTVWVVTGDHGELFGAHGVVTHGRTLYEGEARIPLLVHWPGRLKPRDVYEPVSHLDILPTLAELAGAKPHPAFQGSSLAEPARLSGKHPAIFMNIQGLVRAESVVCWPWKLIVEKNSRTIQLFDLRDDPEELCDLVEQEPGVAAVLAEVLRKQMKVQVEYHRKTSQIRTTHFSPRLMGCPQLPGRDEARRWDEL